MCDIVKLTLFTTFRPTIRIKRMSRALIALSFLLTASVGLCQSSGSSCWKTAMAQSEMSRCADLDLQEADAKLNDVYGRALQFMDKDLADARQQNDEEGARVENEAIANLKHAERAWVSYRDVQCKAAADYDAGSIAPLIPSKCLPTLTEHRIADLKSIYEGRGRKLD